MNLIVFWAIFSIMFFVLVNLTVAQGVNQLGRLGESTTAIENGKAVLQENPSYRSFHRWAEDHGFEAREMIDYHGLQSSKRITVGYWYNPQEKTVLYIHNRIRNIALSYRAKQAFGFTTSLDKDCILVTHNQRNLHNLPWNPENYGQSFHGMDIAPLYEAHLNAVDHVVQHLGRTVVGRSEPLFEAENLDTSRQIAYVKSLPFWWLRGFYWQLVTKYLKNNVSVARQYPAP